MLPHVSVCLSGIPGIAFRVAGRLGGSRIDAHGSDPRKTAGLSTTLHFVASTLVKKHMGQRDPCFSSATHAQVCRRDSRAISRSFLSCSVSHKFIQIVNIQGSNVSSRIVDNFDVEVLHLRLQEM